MKEMEDFFDRVENRLFDVNGIEDVVRGRRVEEDKYLSAGSGPGGNFRQEYVVTMSRSFQEEYDGIGIETPEVELERRVEPILQDAQGDYTDENGAIRAKGLFVSDEAADRSIDYKTDGRLVVKAYFIPEPE